MSILQQCGRMKKKALLKWLKYRTSREWLHCFDETYEIIKWEITCACLRHHMLCWITHAFGLMKDRRSLFTNFILLHYLNQIDSMFPWLCSVRDHRRRQKVGRTSMTHVGVPRELRFCSCHILTSSVIYYWTDTRQRGIYSVTLKLPRSNSWFSLQDHLFPCNYKLLTRIWYQIKIF